MREDMTLGEVRDLCEQLTDKYGDDGCCEHCEFVHECGSAPEEWMLSVVTDNKKVCEGQTNWEEMYQLACVEREECRNRANYLEADNKRLCTILKSIEFALGRKLIV